MGGARWAGQEKELDRYGRGEQRLCIYACASERATLEPTNPTRSAEVTAIVGHRTAQQCSASLQHVELVAASSAAVPRPGHGQHTDSQSNALIILRKHCRRPDNTSPLLLLLCLTAYSTHIGGPRVQVLYCHRAFLRSIKFPKFLALIATASLTHSRN